MNTFALTAVSAWSTLLICDRQARRDCAKIARALQTCYAIATHPEAIRTYRMIYRALEIAVLVTLYLGGLTRRHYERIKADQRPAPVAPETAPLNDPWETAPVEVVVEATPAPQIQITAQPLLPAAPTLRLLPAAKVIAPQPHAPWKEMTAAELRKACTKAGIAWSRAGAGKKNLTKREMIRALEAAAA
jgi:hypothetical protein